MQNPLTCEHPPKGFNTVPNRWQPEKTVAERSVRDQQKTSAWRRATSTVARDRKPPQTMSRGYFTRHTLTCDRRPQKLINHITHLARHHEVYQGEQRNNAGGDWGSKYDRSATWTKTWELSVTWCSSMYFGDRYWMLCVGDNVSFVLIEALIKVVSEISILILSYWYISGLPSM